MDNFTDALANDFISCFLCCQQRCIIYLDDNAIRADNQNRIRDGIKELLPGVKSVFLM